MKTRPDSAAAPRRLIILVAGGLVVAGAVIAGVVFGTDLAGGGKAEQESTSAARRGALVISVSEAGTIQARDQVVIKSEVEGQTTVIFLEEEGKMVEAGALLVELDASGLQDKRVDRDIAVQSAEAAFVSARENLAVVKSQAASDVADAELKFRFAKEDLTQYENGEFPRQRKEAESKITLAQEELKNAAETLRWSEKLFQEKYISQTELDRDRLSENRARLDYELAVSALELLDEFTHKRQLDELKSAILQNEMALERTKCKAAADIVEAEAQLRAREAERDRQVDQLRKLDDQIAKARIVAPSAGMVVYATTGRQGWRGDDEPLHEGGTVREREELIHLPTTNSMMAVVKIRETSLDKVRVGQEVNVTVDALPGREFKGRVAKIAPLPDAQSVWMNPDLKVYPTEIHLEGEISEVRTGMNCRAEIFVERLQNVVYVPIQAVVRVGSQPAVFVAGAEGFLQRDVEIGLDNAQMVHVKRGLEAGEVVLLTPPLQAAASRALQPEAAPAVPTGAPGAPLPAQPDAGATRAPEGAEGAPQGTGSETEGRPRTRRRPPGMGEGGGGERSRRERPSSGEKQAPQGER
ncbi:MAG: efflux RND transporter periplasmic adaptor subunit [Planctomycetes bacterium]|nr:efflux RND transporter periplasmic adaptor subunit [Planctomycetota bacterium]